MNFLTFSVTCLNCPPVRYFSAAYVVCQDRLFFYKICFCYKMDCLNFLRLHNYWSVYGMRLLGQYLISIFRCFFLLYLHNSVVFVLYYLCLCIVLFLSLASRLLTRQVNKQEVNESEINWIIMTMFTSVYADILCSLQCVSVMQYNYHFARFYELKTVWCYCMYQTEITIYFIRL
jgi:hypothetical protein